MLAPLGIGFAVPWLLIGLLALPILWILLRAVPPAPIKRLFPGVILLLGLKDDENQTDKTPWWLLLLRSLAIASVIIGFAGPIVNPDRANVTQGPLLILMDGSWAEASGWSARIERMKLALDNASQQGRPVSVVQLSDTPPGPLEFQSADAWTERLTGLQPRAWEPGIIQPWLEGLGGEFDTFWFSDGLARDSRKQVLTALKTHGDVRVFQEKAATLGLRPPIFDGGSLALEITRNSGALAAIIGIQVMGTDPNGIERVLETVAVEFLAGELIATASIDVQPEIRNRITRFQIDGINTAGAVILGDDGLKRREVAVISGPSDQEGLQLLSPSHFLEQAIAPYADLINGTIGDVLLAAPDVIILADVANLALEEQSAVENWIDGGGLLLRFAGPKLAASDISRGTEDPLMPVRLRAGGRTVGGTMSWGEPKNLQPFPKDSPFFGLDIPADVEVSAQVIAEPDPNLSSRVIAALSDGTPLVTRKKIGAGQVVLFHVTANAEWSTLPLSGLFVEMLDRLSVSGSSRQRGDLDLVGTTWTADQVLDGFGSLHGADNLKSVSGASISEGEIGAQLPPGLYQNGGRTIALNVISADRELALADWPDGISVEGFGTNSETKLAAFFLAAALALLAVDAVASLWIGGRLRGPISGASIAMIALLLFNPQSARAQDEAAIAATSQLVLAYVTTGNPRIDETANAGLRGLSDVLFRRTSVEPAEPVGVDIERDELAFYPFLYWPITTDQPQPTANAIARINRYLQTGGMILFDTRDSDVAGYGVSSPNGRKLQRIAGRLDIPALEPVPDDHVLTRSFYLLDVFPGRHTGQNVWVEAAPPDAELAEGMPFRNLNDNVSPVIIGGNDWASAWAVDEIGNRMFPIGRGATGDRQREIAYRFGVNLIMYVLTGNYKSDQVHVPALLDRLGQ